MSNTDLPSLEYEALQSEKRDRMSARLQIWSLLIALISGFGLASLQANDISYLVGLYPLLTACIARYAGHSEAVLDQIKAYLLVQEHERQYQGYERYNKMHKLKFAVSGGHKKALLQAMILTDALATTALLGRLAAQGWYWLAVVCGILECAVAVATWRCLREPKREEC